MKKINLSFWMTMLLSTFFWTGGLFAATNFYSWNLLTERPLSGVNTQGISCGTVGFTDKNITIELWLNIPEEKATAGAVIASTRHDGSKGFSIDLAANPSNGNSVDVRAFFKNTSVAAGDGKDKIFTLFLPRENFVGKWGHLAFVLSSANNEICSYVNGELYEKIDGVDVDWLGNHTGALRLGYWYDKVVNLFYGKIADFRIWSVARTAEEIKANYNKNLEGTYVENPGLYINYRFYTYERGFVNDANPTVTTNKGWCSPDAAWNTYYTRETLAAFPQNLAVANETLSWDTGTEKWEVSLFKSDDDSQVAVDTLTQNFLNLKEVPGLDIGTLYYAKVRTFNNGVWSGQVASSSFSVTSHTSGLQKLERKANLLVRNGSLIIETEFPQSVNIYTLAGKLLRRVDVLAGKNTISGLPKGLYFAGNQKFVIQ